VAREGNLIKAEWLSATYRAIPTVFDSLTISIDTAFKTGTTNDFSAAVVIGTLSAPRGGYGPGPYLLYARRGKVEFADLKRRVVELHQTWRPQAVLIEDAASGQSLIQELRSGTSLPLVPVRVDRDKLSRIAAITPTLEARRLLLPESAWWRDELVAELTSFPAGAHDDWLDALAQALLWISQNSGWRATFEAYKRLCSALESPEEESESLVGARFVGAPDAVLRHFERRKPRR
jgi:predicted phage terminase large subunit-like protein